MLDSSYQGIKRLLVLAYDNTKGDDRIFGDSFKMYFLPRVNIENYSNDSIKQHDEVRKVSRGQGDDYTTGFLLDFAYFQENYRQLQLAADLSKQKALDADSRAIQQIIFTGKIKAAANTRVIMYYILE